MMVRLQLFIRIKTADWEEYSMVCSTKESEVWQNEISVHM